MTRENDAAAVAGDGAMMAPPCAMVIFGAAGDLTKRLVVPSLYDLVRAKRLPERFQLVGVDLAAKTAADWSQSLSEMMNQFVAQSGGEFHVDQLDRVAWRWLTDRMTYLQGDLNDPGTYRRLGDHLVGLDKKVGTAGNYLFYLAVADRFFSVAVSGLGAAGLVDEKQGQWRRVVIEKPFGHDLASAEALNAEILKTLSERQIYRIDHFLGKETVQNVMALRFANGIFEPIWNRAHIDHVQITAAETVGVERARRLLRQDRRAARHGAQPPVPAVGMTAMEPPNSFDAEAVRSEEGEVVEAIRPCPAEACRRMPCAASTRRHCAGPAGRAYRNEPDVAPGLDDRDLHRLQADDRQLALGRRAVLSAHRQICDAAADGDRHSVPPAPYALFRGTRVEALPPNWLILHIQPDEGIALEFAAKRPGPTVTLGQRQR